MLLKECEDCTRDKFHCNNATMSVPEQRALASSQRTLTPRRSRMEKSIGTGHVSYVTMDGGAWCGLRLRVSASGVECKRECGFVSNLS